MFLWAAVSEETPRNQHITSHLARLRHNPPLLPDLQETPTPPATARSPAGAGGAGSEALLGLSRGRQTASVLLGRHTDGLSRGTVPYLAG